MKILIVNLMQIGDLVLTTPVFEALRINFPKAFIAAAVNKNFSPLVDFNPFINQLFKVDKNSPRSFLKNLSDIRNHHFDFVINLNSSERASALAALSGANLICGYSNNFFKHLFHINVPNLNRLTHQVFSHFNVLNRAGFNLKPRFTNIFVPADIQNRINTFCRNHFNNQNIIAFNVGASWLSKRWLPHYFASLANRFSLYGFNVVFLGSLADVPIVDECLAFIPDKRNIHVLTGRFNLLELATFFDHCRLLITNDSGPMHIAAARNCPSVSIFGSSPVTGFFPFTSNATVIKSPVPCHPCFKHSCPKFSLDCMKAIHPDFVFQTACRRLISKPNPSFLPDVFIPKSIDSSEKNPR